MVGEQDTRGYLVARDESEPLDDFPHDIGQDSITLDRVMTAPRRVVRAEILTDITAMHLSQEQWSHIHSLDTPWSCKAIREKYSSTAPFFGNTISHER